MDPDSTLQQAIAALERHSFTEYRRAMFYYSSWRGRGGFPASTEIVAALEAAQARHIPADLEWGQTPHGWT